MNKMQILVISTAHLSYETARQMGLTEQQTADRWMDEVHSATRRTTWLWSPISYGYLVYAHDDPKPSDPPAPEDYPKDIWDCACFAHAHDCDWINFDCDAATVEGLPVYDWNGMH